MAVNSPPGTATVFFAPAVVGLLGEANLAAGLSYGGTLAQQYLGFT